MKLDPVEITVRQSLQTLKPNTVTLKYNQN